MNNMKGYRMDTTADRPIGTVYISSTDKPGFVQIRFGSVDELAEFLVDRFRSHIKHEMNRLGMRQKDVAEKMGVAPSFVSQLLSGPRTGFTFATIGRLHYAVGLDVNYLFEPFQPAD